MPHYAGQVYQFGGVPVGLNKFVGPWATHYFVDGGAGNDSHSGRKPDRALKTIQAAIDKAVVGDVIYVNPQAYVVGTGHARYTEDVTIALAQSDLSIIGAGYPKSNEFGVRMKTATGYCLTTDAPSLHLENIGFFVDSGGTGAVLWDNDGASLTKRGSDGPVCYNCHFKGGTTLLTGGQAGQFIDCAFYHATGTLTIATPGVSGYNQLLRGCRFLDNNGAAPTGPYLNASGAHVYGLVVEFCTFQQVPSGGKFIVMGGTLNTGVIFQCGFEDDDVHVTNNLTLGGTEMRLVGSYDYAGIIA